MLNVFMIVYSQILAVLDEQKVANRRAEQTINELCEVKTKQKEWYEEQMATENKPMKEIQFCMPHEMAWMKEMYTKELDIL